MEEKYSEKMPCMCLWYDQCQCVTICEHFAPIEDTEDIIDELIEENRLEFYGDFFEYVEENGLYDE